MPPIELAPKTTRGVARPAVWVFWGGLALTTALAWLTWHEALLHDEERFSNLAEQFRQEFETRVERYELGFGHLADWFVENEQATLPEWQNRVEKMGLRVNYPGVTELSYAPAISEVNIPRWQIKIPSHWPPADEWQEWSFPVWYQAAQPPAAAPKWGRKLREEIEVISDISRFAAVRNFSSTGRRLLQSESNGPPLAGFTLLVASFRKEMPAAAGWSIETSPDWPENRVFQRLQGMLGVVAGTICMEPLLESIFGGRNLEIDCEIYAGAVTESNRMNRLGLPSLSGSNSKLYSLKEIPWYYTRWNILAVPNNAFYGHSQRGRVWIVTGAGVLLTLALTWLLRTQEIARASAEAWGRSLEAAREELRAAHRERMRLGRDLHDGALQSVYASVLGLRRASRAVTRDPQKAGKLIEGAVADLESTMQDLRRFLSNTRNEGISAAELPEILRGFVDAFNRIEQSRVALEFDPAVTVFLNGEQAEQLLHVVREAVSNAHRHGQAGEIVIAFSRKANAVVLTIQDNGLGFDSGKEPVAGHGLRYMAERAGLCHGHLRIQSQAGGPTVLHLEIPDKPPAPPLS